MADTPEDFANEEGPDGGVTVRSQVWRGHMRDERHLSLYDPSLDSHSWMPGQGRIMPFA